MTALVLGCDPGLGNFGWTLVELHRHPTPPPGVLFGKPSAEHVIRFGTISTEKSRKVKGVKLPRKCDDQLRRIVELAQELGSICKEHGEIGAIVAEAQSWPHPPTMETTAFMQRDQSADLVGRVKREILASFDAGNLSRGELARRLDEIVPRSNALDNVERTLQKHASATYGVLGASTMIAFSWGVLGCLAALLDLEVIQASPQRVRIDLLGQRGGGKSLVHAALVKRYGEDALAGILAMPKAKREHVLDALAAVVVTLDTKEITRLRASAAVEEEDIDFG